MSTRAASGSRISGVIVGHSNMDLDCLGSIVLARHLYPDFVALRSGRIHPLASVLYHMYQSHLNLKLLADLDGAIPGHVVVVDTRTPSQVKEYFEGWKDCTFRLTIYDHHSQRQSSKAAAEDAPSIPDTEQAFFENGGSAGTELVYEPVGANTSMLCGILMRRGMSIGPEDATIALAGIYADTGGFSHANVCARDFEAARWLAEQGAHVPLVQKLMNGAYDEQTAMIQHEMISRAQIVKINGSAIMMAEIELEKQVPGLSMVTEKVFDIEHADAIFAVFSMAKEECHLIVARSRSVDCDVAYVLAPFGGGGHAQSASALVKKSKGVPVGAHLKRMLPHRMASPETASGIMIATVDCIIDSWSLLEASLFLETRNHTGAPVVDKDNILTGMLTLRDIQKARKADRMQAPVKAFMTKNIVVVAPETPVREVETLFFRTDLTHVPVTKEHRILGLICRSDLLRYLQTLE